MAEAKSDPRNNPTVRVVLRLLGVLALILSPIAIYHGTARYLEGRDSPNWPRVPGEVYDQRVYESTRKGSTSYAVYIKYRYAVDGKSYNGERVRPNMDSVSVEDRDRVLAKYPVGSKPDVAYAPSDPAQSFLEPSPESTAIVTAILPWIIPVIGVVLLLLSRKPKPNGLTPSTDDVPSKPDRETRHT